MKTIVFLLALVSTSAAAGPLSGLIQLCKQSGGNNNCIYDLLDALDSRAHGSASPSLTMGIYQSANGAQLELHNALIDGGGSFSFEMGSGSFGRYTCNSIGSCRHPNAFGGYTEISVIDRTSFNWNNARWNLTD